MMPMNMFPGMQQGIMLPPYTVRFFFVSTFFMIRNLFNINIVTLAEQMLIWALSNMSVGKSP